MRTSLRLGIILALGTGAYGASSWLSVSARTETVPPLREVKVMRVDIHDLPRQVEAVGAVSPLQQVEIVTQVDGQLVSCLFNEGQEVTSGSVLFQVDPRIYQARLQQSQAALEKDQAQQAYAQMQLHRAMTLVKAGDQTLETTESRAASVAETEATIASDRAAIAVDTVQLNFTSIKAPISGRIGKRFVDVGNVVLAHDAKPLATITQLDPIAVEFHVPQASLDAISEAAHRETLRVETFDESSGRKLAVGSLDLVEDSIDPATATVVMRAVFPNKQRTLWPGQLVGARVSLGSVEHVPAVPFGALKQSVRGYLAYVVDPAGIVQMRAVTPGLQVDGLQGVTEGLQAGDLVVLSDQDALAPGLHVRPTIVSPAQATS